MRVVPRKINGSYASQPLPFSRELCKPSPAQYSPCFVPNLQCCANDDEDFNKVHFQKNYCIIRAVTQLRYCEIARFTNSYGYALIWSQLGCCFDLLDRTRTTPLVWRKVETKLVRNQRGYCAPTARLVTPHTLHSMVRPISFCALLNYVTAPRKSRIHFTSYLTPTYCVWNPY